MTEPKPEVPEISSPPQSAPCCVICEGPLGRKPARGACQTCWRKFRAAGLTLPRPSKPGPRARDPLQVALARLSLRKKLSVLALLGRWIARRVDEIPP